jgi:glutamyl-tRNA synthetase
MGFLPEAMANYMSLLGWTPPDATKEIFSLREAAQEFSLDRVNKAGAKFDWAKLDWINSQYLHQMPADKLVELLIPYWQQAGYEVNLESDRPWLESLTALVGPSLTRLADAVKETKIFFGDTVEYGAEAVDLLKQEGVTGIIQEVIDAVASSSPLTEENAQEIIKQATKTQKVKKGLIMRSLRASLTGELHGPDLIQSWLLLNDKGLDKIRLQQAITVSSDQRIDIYS